MLDNFFNPETASQRLSLERRDLLKIGLAGLVGAVLPMMPARNAYALSNYESWKISFRHQRTGESFSGVYRVGDKYLPEAFERINYVLRDARTEEVFPMDPRVVDILSMIHKRAGSNEPYETLSGYRSPKTNANLRKASTGVATNSFHMYGQAVDFRIAGASTSKLRNAAKALKAGGVGYYPRSNFVHVDTGTVRSW